jgi:hypothetical protein
VSTPGRRFPQGVVGGLDVENVFVVIGCAADEDAERALHTRGGVAVSCIVASICPTN